MSSLMNSLINNMPYAIEYPKWCVKEEKLLADKE